MKTPRGMGAKGMPGSDGKPKNGSPGSSNKRNKSKKNSAPVEKGVPEIQPYIPPEFRVPVHAMKHSQKRGLVWVHVTLPRSVPSSVINLDAKEAGFHLDTGNVSMDAVLS